MSGGRQPLAQLLEDTPRRSTTNATLLATLRPWPHERLAGGVGLRALASTLARQAGEWRTPPLRYQHSKSTVPLPPSQGASNEQPDRWPSEAVAEVSHCFQS